MSENRKADITARSRKECYLLHQVDYAKGGRQSTGRGGQRGDI